MTEPGQPAGRPIPVTFRIAAVLGTIAALAGLAACGSAAAGGGAGQPAASPNTRVRASATAANASGRALLCADARAVDRVRMRLTASHPGEILPRAMTITDPPRARALAAGLCALPPMPGGLRCPAARGGALRLDFAAAGRRYQPVLIRDSGCASVTGAGPVRQWAWSSRPGRLLATAAGSYGRLVAGTHPSSVPTP